MASDNTITIYKNGVLTTPISELCTISKKTSSNVENNVIIGKNAKVDIDFFIVWEKRLTSKTIQDLHNVYKGKMQYVPSVVSLKARSH